MQISGEDLFIVFNTFNSHRFLMLFLVSCMIIIAININIIIVTSNIYFLN